MRFKNRNIEIQKQIFQFDLVVEYEVGQYITKEEYFNIDVETFFDVISAEELNRLKKVYDQKDAKVIGLTFYFKDKTGKEIVDLQLKQELIQLNKILTKK